MQTTKTSRKAAFTGIKSRVHVVVLRPVQASRALVPVVQSVAAGATEAAKVDGRALRRSLNQTGRYVRQPTNDPVSQQLMDEHGVGYSTNGLVAQMRNDGNIWKQGTVTVKLAKAYGYCWGVERAVRMAYEARQAHPDKKLFVTNEIIHNPEVNKRLKEMNIEIIEDEGDGKDYSQIGNGDVVIFPAFGATVKELSDFRDKGVQMVDTTCPWVAKVWNSVDTHTRKQYTSVIHGKYSHEETIATASFASNYVIVKDLKEAQYVCDYILHGGNKEEFLAKFSKAVSKGFDPDTMLDRVGLANQTTMLKGETEQIGKMLEATMMQKYGPAELNNHFLLMETICDATQERQDALYDMVADPEVDFLIVVGGFNSSNTSHLQEIAEHKGLPSFWVDSAARIDVEKNTVLHKLAHGELRETVGWLTPGKPVTIGITSGASTPDRAVEEVLAKVFKIYDPNFTGIAPKDCGRLATPEEH
ncbi:4-hydroxy-3-methylbut-2-enyl diphosphate reductase chloroplast precursor [Volvox carteri f. nagariensis]|uniref:4-hydroxy-3-methylbut-2-enyl diphosphate reductase n=1 Tax=Volvox carteri f. nagariensis TaxID=3068 RepID=D8TLJ9_VOLCA|nr:4-hydroxy-3-methylbut-2-enyl diphosphate reductase chloroplast precursor [Volvox carteri f. nagariensis]EFJ51887.1 4-hydroxy-3-methylbut-2-enyl diphosphate reductase chloroplast precursor [Volvox carteri f. nagariensis]|eukprot:XP_002947297.1 4-hydroxy-3-methylbut-2-enyl diphosphate reductase chloroplast precursor [Volvox carteri f. nagariensis]